MKPRAGRMTLGLSVVALLGGASAGGYAWWRGEQRQAIVASALPPMPDLSSWPAELRHRIESCERRARAGERPIEALGELSRLYHANGFLAEAAQCYQALEQLAPKEPRWAHRLATIYAGYGQADVAIALLRQVVERAPDYTAAGLRLADLLLKTNDLAEARRTYEEILKRHPDEPYAQLGVARCEVEQEQWTQARDRLERVVRQTNFQLGYDLIVTVYERLGQHERAEAVRGQALASGAYRDFPDPWMDELFDDSYDLYQLSLTAGVAERGGDTETAVRRLQRALRLAPDNYSVHFQLGLTHLARKEVAKARQHLERATELEPTFSDAWSQLSNLHATHGDPATANRVLSEGLRHSPNSFGLRLMRARRLKEEGRLQEAIRDYQLAIAQRPNAADGYVELAVTYLRIEDTERAVAELKKSLVAEPENPTALTALALNAITIGDESEARHWIQRARDQPRVRRDQVQTLVRKYREHFGRLPE